MGDSVDIPVLDNDAHPDGEQLTLNPELPSGLRSASGLLFASGDVLRYLAPERSGNFTAVYEVAGPDGQVDQAEVRIAVRESVAATNSAPVPGPVTARVLAGETVRIKIPLTGIDPDGDSVQLLGQDTSPQKGAVTGVGSDYIDYLAGEYSAGTDTFTYRVIDSLGKRAIGTVRVGISPRSGDAGNPIAVEDEVLIRPGKTVSVQVLANDSDPDGSPLTILSVEPNSPDIVFEVVDDIVRVTPPSDPGRYGLVYTIENAYGGTSSNFITVVVDPDAPPAYPVAGHRAHPVRHRGPRHGQRRRAPERVLRRRQRVIARVVAASRLRRHRDGAGQTARHHHHRPAADHPVLGREPRRPDDRRLRVRLGSRLRRRPPAA
jgi:hypothetical protein